MHVLLHGRGFLLLLLCSGACGRAELIALTLFFVKVTFVLFYVNFT